jgi:hypothetical protein
MNDDDTNEKIIKVTGQCKKFKKKLITKDLFDSDDCD